MGPYRQAVLLLSEEPKLRPGLLKVWMKEIYSNTAFPTEEELKFGKVFIVNPGGRRSSWPFVMVNVNCHLTEARIT